VNHGCSDVVAPAVPRQLNRSRLCHAALQSARSRAGMSGLQNALLQGCTSPLPMWPDLSGPKSRGPRWELPCSYDQCVSATRILALGCWGE
jgi:hypothetical protein